MMQETTSRILRERLPYAGVTAGVILLDQWSKTLVESRLAPGTMQPVVEGFFDLTHLQNPGVAFGLLSGSPSAFRLAVLSAFAGLAALVVIIYSVRSPASERGLQTALALILGGAIGNLYDRLTVGQVTDFLYVHVKSYYWPAFNVADIAISVGVGLMVLGILVDGREARGRS